MNFLFFYLLNHVRANRNVRAMSVQIIFARKSKKCYMPSTYIILSDMSGQI